MWIKNLKAWKFWKCSRSAKLPYRAAVFPFPPGSLQRARQGDCNFSHAIQDPVRRGASQEELRKPSHVFWRISRHGDETCFPGEPLLEREASRAHRNVRRDGGWKHGTACAAPVWALLSWPFMRLSCAYLQIHYV